MDSDLDATRTLLLSKDLQGGSKLSNTLYPTPTNVPATSSISSLHQLQSNQHIVTQRGLTKSDSVMGIDSNGHVPTTTEIRLQRNISKLTNYLYGLAIVVVIGSIIVITVIVSLYAKLSHDLKHQRHRPKVGEQIASILDREELCVKCSEVLLGPSPEERHMLKAFTRRESVDGDECCVEEPVELLRLLELYIEKRYRQEMAKGLVSVRSHVKSSMPETDVKVAAHLMINPQPQIDSDVPGRQVAIASWLRNVDLAFIQQVIYRHGRIVVPLDGLYFIYSQVSFMEALPSSRSTPSDTQFYQTTSPTVSHYLYRYNIIYPDGGEEKLIQNSISKYWGSRQKIGEYTSYLGAAFLLRKGDEIFVKVSNLTMLTYDPKSCFFGLFKV